MAKIKELVVKVLKEEVKIFQSRLERWDEEVEDGLWKTSGVTGLQAAIDVIESRIDELESIEQPKDEDESGKITIREVPFDQDDN